MSSICDSDLDQLWSWNARFPETISTPVQELIIARARSQPRRLAIHARDGDCNYEQLVTITSRIAKHLRPMLNLQHGRVLPIWMEKSRWMPLTMLGALMGGWGIAPIAADTPKDKVIKILDMLNPPFVLTTLDTQSHLAMDIPIPMLPVEHLGQREPDDTQRHSELNPVHVAAVVFTSGSTGSSKGVVIPPECLTTGAVNAARIMQVNQKSRLFQFISYSLDTSLYEMFMTLIAGGCLCIPSETERLDGLISAINAMGANFFCTTPSVAMSILGDVSDTPLQTMALTGEPLKSRVVDLLDTPIRLYNWYGASECPIVAVGPVERDTWKPSQINSRNPGNCWVVRLDGSDVLCGFGEVGELLVESPMLTTGYLNAAHLNGSAFLIDPAWLVRGHGQFSGRRGRLYRTGDVVSSNPDGTFDYIGRKDGMVKIRGQRVDLREVEEHLWNVLRSEPLSAKTDAVQMIAESISLGRSESRILACFISISGQHKQRARLGAKAILAGNIDQPSTVLFKPDSTFHGLKSALDKGLRKTLPEYMVPSVYFEVGRLPLTTTGKIDRRLLRHLAETTSPQDLIACRSIPSDNCVGPHDETEHTLVRLWAQILDLDTSTLSTCTNFVQCGGDSLRAITLARALQKTFQLHVQVSQLLRPETTIQHLAMVLQRTTDGSIAQKSPLDISAALSCYISELEQLPTMRNPPAAPSNTGAVKVFLTGATGYLGTHILSELVACQQVARIVVLVRGSDAGHALARVRNAGSVAGWWHEFASACIEVWVGDLAKPQFGLEREQWQQIADMDIIIHNGAVVNYTADYESLELPNVRSTAQLLQVALSSAQIRTFVYVSGGTKKGPNQLDEEYVRDINRAEAYSQTKYVAEQMTVAAARIDQNRNIKWRFSATTHGILVRPCRQRFMVIKPGYIVGDQVSGLSNVDDFLWKLVAGVVRMGSYPADPPDSWLDIAEVTRVAQHILRRCQLGAADPPLGVSQEIGAAARSQTLEHLDRGLPVSHFWSAVQSQTGIHLTSKEWSDWIVDAHKEMDIHMDSHPLWGVQQFLGPRLGSPDPIRTRAFHGSIEQNEIENAVRRCVEYLIEIQFIHLPSRSFCLDSRDGNHTNFIGGEKHESRRIQTNARLVRLDLKQQQQTPTRISRTKFTY